MKSFPLPFAQTNTVENQDEMVEASSSLNIRSHLFKNSVGNAFTFLTYFKRKEPTVLYLGLITLYYVWLFIRSGAGLSQFKAA